MKACTKCGVVSDNFKPKYNKTGPPRPRAQCRVCDAAYEKSRRDPRSTRDIGLKHKFNITLADEERLLREQDGCAICHTWEPGTGPGGGWTIDHDHSCCPQKGRSCGKCVRGVLCQPCNRGLGQFRDNIDRLKSAVNYLERFENE